MCVYLVTNILDLFLFYLILSTYHFLESFCSVFCLLFGLSFHCPPLILEWKLPLLGIFFKLLIQISNLKSKSYYFQYSEKKKRLLEYFNCEHHLPSYMLFNRVLVLLLFLLHLYYLLLLFYAVCIYLDVCSIFFPHPHYSFLLDPLFFF